ncbi:alpha/beta fold hydrolase [Aeromicrobium sp. CF4.19]|uniref:alpha/beta fold hydrolase n=1 Tax=Aeromicrobium sp. CF4.19 TaxID=3373082 RepID=UPI003EE4FA3C
MTTFVLVPGGGGAAQVWDRLVPELERDGHRAVALDLRLDADIADLEPSIELVAQAVRAVEGRTVLVGLSFGGFVAPAAALGERVDALVLLNAMIPSPGESARDWWSAVGQAEARRENERAAGRDPERPFDAHEVMLHDASPDIVHLAEDRSPSDAMFDAPWPGARWPDVPTTVLVADDDRLFPPSLQERVARERLGADVMYVPGGHMAPLTRPKKLAEALLKV